MKTQLTIFIIPILFLFGCSTTTPSEEEEKPVSTSITLTDEFVRENKIEIGFLPLLPISTSIKTNGTVEVPSISKANVYALTSGIIRNIYVLPGEKVVKGQRLATITDMGIIQMQEDFLSASARLEYLEPEMKRKKELAATDAVSKKEMEKSISEYKSELSRLNSLKNKLRLLGISSDHLLQNGIQSEINLLSPINGYVSEGKVAIGDAVHESKLLFEIIDDSNVHIVLNVPVSKIHDVQIGQICEYGVNTSNEKLIGKVHLIGKKVNEANGTVEVHVDPDKGNRSPIVGSNVYASILTGTDTVPAISTSELVRKGDNFYLYVQNGKSWEAQKVNLGIRDDQYTEITSEDIIRLKVVIKGNYLIANE